MKEFVNHWGMEAEMGGTGDCSTVAMLSPWCAQSELPSTLVLLKSQKTLSALQLMTVLARKPS